MAKFHARPSLQYRYEHYDPQMGWPGASSEPAGSDSSDEDDSPAK